MQFYALDGEYSPGRECGITVRGPSGAPIVSMTFRVALNATPLLSPLTGIGNYIVELGRALAASGDVDCFSFYRNRWRHEAPTPAVNGSRTPTGYELRRFMKPLIPFGRRLHHAQQRWQFARGLRRFGVELYHEPNYIPLRYDVPVVITVHDLSWLRYPQTHPPDRVRWLDTELPRALEQADAVLVDSDFVRNELLEAFGLESVRVHTAHLGVSGSFRPRDASETRATLHRLGLVHGEYLLTVGTIEPRKNIRHVLMAYARLPEAMRKRYPLVIAGAKGWRAGSLERDLRGLVDNGLVRFVGFVSPDDLPMLYAGAALFVFASLYEGFGLPPLEAMASGIPVLVSDRASLPEVAGDAAIRLDPELPDDTAVKIESMLDDEAQRDDFSMRGRRRAAGFTWAACGRATLDVYRSALAAKVTG